MMIFASRLTSLTLAPLATLAGGLSLSLGTCRQQFKPWFRKREERN
jgi:hypothetical protein